MHNDHHKTAVIVQRIILFSAKIDILAVEMFIVEYPLIQGICIKMFCLFLVMMWTSCGKNLDWWNSI